MTIGPMTIGRLESYIAVGSTIFRVRHTDRNRNGDQIYEQKYSLVTGSCLWDETFSHGNLFRKISGNKNTYYDRVGVWSWWYHYRMTHHRARSLLYELTYMYHESSLLWNSYFNLKGTVWSQSKQIFNRAWNPNLRWTQGLKINASFMQQLR